MISFLERLPTWPFYQATRFRVFLISSNDLSGMVFVCACLIYTFSFKNLWLCFNDTSGASRRFFTRDLLSLTNQNFCFPFLTSYLTWTNRILIVVGIAVYVRYRTDEFKHGTGLHGTVFFVHWIVRQSAKALTGTSWLVVVLSFDRLVLVALRAWKCQIV